MPKPVSLLRSAFFIILILISISVPGCSSNAQAVQGNIDSIAKSKLGSAYTISYNESKQFALCQQTPGSNDHALRTFKFIVVKISNNTISREGDFRNGYVKWITANSIELSSSAPDEKNQTRVITIDDQQS